MFVIRNWHLSHQKAHRTAPSVVVESFQSSNLWKSWNFYKNCVVKYKNVKDVRLFDDFGVLVAILFFLENGNYLRKQPYWPTWLKVSNVPIHEIFRNLTKVAWKREKLVHFEVSVIFGRKLCVFVITKLRLFPEKSFPDNKFVPCGTSLKFEATKVFQNYTKTA